VLLQSLVRAQARGPLRRQERRLLQYEGRVRLRVQMQHREQAPWRFDERAQARGPVIRPEREPLQWHERLPLPALLRWLLRVPEQGPHKGQGLPQLSGVRPPKEVIER
jgi:hypothetical protein